MRLHNAIRRRGGNPVEVGVLMALSALVLAGCTAGGVHGKADPPGTAGQGGGGVEGGQGDAGGGGGGAGGGGGGGAAGGGEACAEPGATRECSPAPCKRGTQTCQVGSKTASGGTWGPCMDVKDVPGCMPDAPCDCSSPSPACEDYCKGRDGGTESPPPSCSCPPGASRGCHGGEDWCYPGKQKCAPGGTWGPCMAAPDDTTVYDLCTCLRAGGCCENDEKHYTKKGAYKDGTGPSYGKCPGLSCGGAPPPPDHTCFDGKSCTPGAKIYCSVIEYEPGAGVLKYEWGTQVCASASGKWGACTKASPPPGCPASYDSHCCALAGKCCRPVGDSGVDTSCAIGNCASACP